ncbi:MAG TPA: LLM class flavin-dependent oxidoreductase [Streptosporangiaceae bacterium]|jgi:alkanesulfonate monooxygenase SsuD/methylene tetrahydromethanopterin reductase-like flavin-dependent oxidoreductase (luciferase family)|nr:LLM class flavin-dependent oxidoreductase [Streptosporangiaceae bacterium]
MSVTVQGGQAAPPIPDPAVVVLVGASGSGKSAWAAEHYLPREIVSSDQLRSIVGSGEHDLDASADAFALLDQIVTARAGRRLTTVIDTLGLDPVRRLSYLALARRAGLPAVAVLFDTDAAVCRQRNRARSRPVPAAVLDAQLVRLPDAAGQLPAEGWDAVISPEAAAVEPAHSPGSLEAARQQRDRPASLEFILQVSRFGWADDPAGWLRSVALAAAETGLHGVALMDHLIQIPQVGRPFEPIPEPWVTLGFLAALDTRLRLGTLVSPVTFRPPGILAKTAATLDALSGGRVFCGIGAGWWDREHAGFGLPFPPPATRLRLLETEIEILRALWQPGTKSYRGEHVSLPETTCYPRPVAPIPVIVGGSGQRTLRIAARLADGCNLPADPGLLDARIPELRRQCELAGRDPSDVAVTVLDVPVVGRDREHAAALVETLRGRTSAAAFARSHHAGTAADHIGRYRLLAERGVSTVFIALPDLAGPDDVARLAPVIRAFA